MIFVIYKRMYVAYVSDKDIKINECSKVLTHTLGYYDNLAVLYYESSEPDVAPPDFASGSTQGLPDGRHWIEATEIFHYFEPKNDAQWVRKIENKTGRIFVSHLNRDMIASYIYYHVEHQHDNQIGVDKFLSIFLFEDIAFMYSETPTEKVTWDDIKGRNHHGARYKWTPLMRKHLKEWPDGTKSWKSLKKGM